MVPRRWCGPGLHTTRRRRTRRRRKNSGAACRRLFRAACRPVRGDPAAWHHGLDRVFGELRLRKTERHIDLPFLAGRDARRSFFGIGSCAWIRRAATAGVQRYGRGSLTGARCRTLGQPHRERFVSTRSPLPGPRATLHAVLSPASQARSARFFRVALRTIVTLGLLAVIIGTVPEIESRYGASISALTDAIALLFAAEYLLRLCHAPFEAGITDESEARTAARARWSARTRWATSPRPA
jgi:hypothetical protein